MKPNEIASGVQHDRAMPDRKPEIVVWNQTRVARYPKRLGRKEAVNRFIAERPASEGVPTIHRVIKGDMRPSELAMQITDMRAEPAS